MWIGRRWNGFRNWYGRQSWPRRVLFLAALASPFGCCVGGAYLVGLYNYWVVYTPEDREFRRNGRSGYISGLPSVGRRLKSEMEGISDPDTAVRLHPDWKALRFPNGEWVFGRGYGGMELTVGNGTAVLKDSRGRVRIFFGVVRGPNAPLYIYADAKTLDEFDRRLRKDGDLREWVPD